MRIALKRYTTREYLMNGPYGADVFGVRAASARSGDRCANFVAASRAALHPYAFLICRMGVRILTSSDRPVHVPPQTR